MKATFLKRLRMDILHNKIIDIKQLWISRYLQLSWLIFG